MNFSNNNTTSLQVNSQEVLRDIRRNGKEFDWKGRKIKNVYYSGLLDILQYKKATRVKECAEVLEFLQNSDGTLSLDRVWFCKSKLCPMCNWRRSMKLGYQNMEILEHAMSAEPNARFLFLTLTVKNVYGGSELKKAMSALTKGFNRLFKYVKVDKNMIGWIRTTEVTINEKDNSYHPHIHVLLMVKSTFFKDSDNYIKHNEWVSLWKRAMKLDYDPFVDIRAIKSKKGSSTKAAVLETSKYPVKDSEYLTEDLGYDLNVVYDLEYALYKKRQLAYGGLLRKIREQLQLDDVEDGDLADIGNDDEDDIDEDAKSIVAIFDYYRKNYYVLK